MIRLKKGQSTLEYLVVFAAVVTVCVVFLAKPGSIYRTRLNQTYGNAANTVVTASNTFFNSF